MKCLFSSTYSGSVNRNVIKQISFFFARMYSEPNQIRAPTMIIPSLSLKEQKIPKSQVLGGPRRPYQHSQKIETFLLIIISSNNSGILLSCKWHFFYPYGRVWFQRSKYLCPHRPHVRRNQFLSCLSWKNSKNDDIFQRKLL